MHLNIQLYTSVAMIFDKNVYNSENTVEID